MQRNRDLNVKPYQLFLQTITSDSNCTVVVGKLSRKKPQRCCFVPRSSIRPFRDYVGKPWEASSPPMATVQRFPSSSSCATDKAPVQHRTRGPTRHGGKA